MSDSGVMTWQHHAMTLLNEIFVQKTHLYLQVQHQLLSQLQLLVLVSAADGCTRTDVAAIAAGTIPTLRLAKKGGAAKGMARGVSLPIPVRMMNARSRGKYCKERFSVVH